MDRTTSRIQANTRLRHEIAQREQAKRTLLWVEPEKQIILDHLPAHVAYYDTAMRFVWLNRAQCEYLGKPREGLIGRPCHEVVWRLAAPCADCAVVAAMESGDVQDIERVTPDGKHWVIRAFPIRDDAGAVVGGVELCVDVTARKRAEEALRVSEDRYRQLVELAPLLIGVAVDQRFSCINPAGVALLGATDPGQLIGRHVMDFVHPEFRDAARARLNKVSQEGTAAGTVEEKWLRLDGSEVDVAVAAMPFQQGSVTAIQVLAQDITAGKQAQQLLLRTERLTTLGRLSASLAHEINNPLQIIHSHLELLMDFPVAPREREEYLDVIRHEVERLKEVSRHVLDLARPESGDVPQADVSAAVKHVLALTRKILERAGIRLTVDLQELPVVPIAPERLSVVFLNLVVNAVQAMRGTPNGCLDISARKAVDDVTVTFTDNGPSIDAAELPRLFEPFYTTKADGSGLGLWISRELLRDVGSIEVVNLSDSQGARFVVRLRTEIE